MTARWLVDTNVISELFRVRPNRKVAAWLAGSRKSSLWISTVNLAEIRYGIEIHRDPDARRQLTAFLREVVRPLFAERVFEAGEEELLTWRFLATRAQKAGRTLPHPDSLIAAIATTQRVSVATRDVEPFVYAGVPVLNPWTGERFNGA